MNNSNKFKSLLISFLILFIVCSCKDNIPIVDENELPSVASNTWILSSLDNVALYVSAEPENKVNLIMGKNEFEHFQLVLGSKENGEFTIIRDIAHSSLQFSCRSIKMFEGKEDVLVPCNNKIIVNNLVSKLWITYQTTPETPVGEYKELIRFKGNSSEFIIQVTINVKDVTIPQTPSLTSLFGVDPSRLMIQGLSKTKIEEKKKEVSDLLLTYRISPYFSTWLQGSMKVENSSSPYAWNDPRTLDYLKDPRFSRIVLPFHELTELELNSMLDQIETKGLSDKVLFYLWDEPTKVSEYEHIKDYASIIQKYSTKAKVITTFYRGPEDGDQANDLFAVFDILHGATRIFCTGVWSLQANELRSEQCKAKLKLGEEWWTYVCMGDRPGLAYSSTAIENRAALWRSWKEGSTGFLYWVVNSFSSTIPLKPRYELPAGDGVLVYPGEPFGSTVPVVSMRLERWRDGAEDYEMLLLMEKIKGKEAAKLLLHNVYKSPIDIAIRSEYVDAFHEILTKEICK